MADSARVVVCASAEHRCEQAAQRGHRDAERAEGDWGGVGDERQRGRHDRLEAEAATRRGDRDWRAEAGTPSMSALKQNATSSSWMRRSPVSRESERRMTSKSPLSTDRL